MNTLKPTNFFRMTEDGERTVTVGTAEDFINTADFNHAQAEVAERLNTELRRTLSLQAFGHTDGWMVSKVQQPTTITLPKWKPISPKGANDAKTIVATMVEGKLVGKACGRAVNMLRDNPHWTPREAALAAAAATEGESEDDARQRKMRKKAGSRA
jgi:hypothetical protein